MALTKDLTSSFLCGPDRERVKVKTPLAADAVIFLGAIVGWDAAGYLVTADLAAAGKQLAVAICPQNNTGGVNGAQETYVMTRGMVDLAAGALTQANVGSPIFATSDNTLSTVDNGRRLGVMVDLIGGRARIQVG